MAQSKDEFDADELNESHAADKSEDIDMEPVDIYDENELGRIVNLKLFHIENP